MENAEERIEAALKLAFNYGGIDGAHHKMWVIDQIVRTLTGESYENWKTTWSGDPDDEDNYYGEWDTGIAP